MKRLAFALPLLLLVAAGCGSGMNLAGTKLKVTAINPYVGLAVFHLDCSPSNGDVSDPAAACSALAHDPKLVTSPQPIDCSGTATSSFNLTISGRLAGKPVHRNFFTCWTPQMATLGKLGLADSLRRHVRPRRRGVVIADMRRTFRAGTLRPGDFLVCEIRHHHLELGIPESRVPIGRTGVGFGGKLTEVGNSPNETLTGVMNVTLSGTRNADGSITATCRHHRT